MKVCNEIYLFIVFILNQKQYFQESQMLADIGGSLGLFIGASVLSFGEIVELFLECINALHRRLRRRNRYSQITLK